MKRVTIGILLMCLFLGEYDTLACTTAVISGRFTKNGRPMIWKIRDTEEYDNHMRRFKSPLGYYVGLVNDSDPEGTQIWGGHNESGFAIMNSASFNVNMGDTTSIENQEGKVMKQALAQCVTLQDFESLLDNLPKPMGLAAHFGVIDAEGGAAFYEVNNQTWTKYDANIDPKGYVLRTNFSDTGKEDAGLGYVRFSCATNLFTSLKPGTLTTLFIGSDMSRSMYNEMLQYDFRDAAVKGTLPGKSGFINSDDLMSRYGTSSMILVEGVKKGENPELTTSWVMIGNPYLCPLIPVWTWEEIPPALRRPLKDSPMTMAQKAKILKRDLYPLKTVEEARYLYMPLIYRPDGEGLSQKLASLEETFIPKIDATTDRAERKALQKQLIEIGMALMDKAIPK